MVLTHPVEPKTVTTDKFKVYAIERGRAQTELRIPLQKQRGNYRIEFRLEGTFQGREGIFDRKVLYQIIDNDDPRLMTPGQFRRMKSARRKMSFQSALKKKPRSPDIRLLFPKKSSRTKCGIPSAMR
jgi:hypothetical protein